MELEKKDGHCENNKMSNVKGLNINLKLEKK